MSINNLVKYTDQKYSPKPYVSSCNTSGHASFSVLCLVVIIVLTGFVWYYQQQNTSFSISSTTHTYTLASRWINVWSQTFRSLSSGLQSVVVYPITGIASIDSTTTSYINTMDLTLQRQSKIWSLSFTPVNKSINYRVLHQDTKTISIYVVSKLTTNNKTIAERSKFWTFDKASGQPITTVSLFDTLTTGMKELARALKRQILLQYPNVNKASMETLITPESLRHFIIHSRSHIGFLFNKQSLGIGLDGVITVTLPISQFSSYLQNPTARKLFDIPTIPAQKIAGTRNDVFCRRYRCIALTFDDGPGQYTTSLLSSLKQYKAKATFFVVGKHVLQYPTMLQQTVLHGHQIGNHTWSHPLLPQLNTADIYNEITKTNHAIASTTGTLPSLLRPPYGAVDNQVYSELKNANLPAILWSVDTRDWADKNPTIVCQRAVSGASPGAIILMHDIHKSTVDAAPCILAALQKQGYRFVTISDLFGGAIQPGVGYFKK